MKFTSRLRLSTLVLTTFSLTACAITPTHSLSSRSLALLEVVEAADDCTIPINDAARVFKAAGFTSGDERVNLVWELRTKAGALSVFNRNLEATTAKCGRVPIVLVADKQTLELVKEVFVQNNCRIHSAEMQALFEPRGFASSWDLAPFLQVLYGAGVLTLDRGSLELVDVSGC